MSAPDIFFLRFQNAPWSDPCFMSLGRLLALSQRVESHCRSLALYVKMRLSAPSPLESECPVPQIRNNFFRLVSQSFWPSFVKYTAPGVRYPRLMCSLS
jgi:hypothetical protein